MATSDSNGIARIEDTDDISPLQTVFNLVASSVSDAFDLNARVFKVANTTARAALVTDRNPSPSDPLFVWRADASTGLQLEYTTNGTTWNTVRTSNDGTVHPTASGRVAVASLAVNGVTSSIPITFPSGLFSTAPRVALGAEHYRITAGVGNITTTGAGIIAYNGSNATSPASYVDWVAVQA